MIDSDGYRANVGIVICNDANQLLWARRKGQDAWQFPQGGVNEGETPEQAMYRELWEEVGLQPDDVELIEQTSSWLRYKLPGRMLKKNQIPLCIGQKQRWYLLRLKAAEDKLDFNRTDSPEFDQWRWVDYWYPIKQVVYFKRRVYRCALQQMSTALAV